jgi:hypothetical protein
MCGDGDGGRDGLADERVRMRLTDMGVDVFGKRNRSLMHRYDILKMTKLN